MALVKMKPPVGVTVGLGSDKKTYTVDQQGFAYVDSTAVAGLTAKGWASVTDTTPGNPDNTVRFITDLTGGIEKASAGDQHFSLVPRQSTAVLFGDSLTDRYSSGSGVNQYTNQTSYLVWAFAKAGWPARVIADAGVAGNTSAQMLARIDADVLSKSPDVVFFLGPINDINQDVPVEETMSNLAQIVAKITNSGARLVVGTVWPSSVINSDARRNSVYQINSYWRALPRANKLVYLADSNAYLSKNDGTYGANTLLNESGVFLHPTALGAERASKPYDALMPVLFAGQRENGISTAAGYDNYSGNGAMVGSNATGTNGFTVGTGITGTGPNGWAIARSGSAIVATCAKVARSDRPSQEWFRVTIGIGGADSERLGLSQTLFFRTWSANGTANFIRRFYVPATGCQYEVIVSGNLAATDNTATWPTTIGAEFVDGTATLRSVRPFNAGDVIQLFAEFALSSVTTGQIVPQCAASIRDASNTALIILNAGYYDSASMGNAPTLNGQFTFASTEATIPATFDLSTTTGSAGPNIVIQSDFITRNAATGVCDYGPIVLRHVD